MWNVRQLALTVLLFALSIVGHSFSLQDGFSSIVNPLVGVAVALIVSRGWTVLVPATIAVSLGYLLRIAWLPSQPALQTTAICLFALVVSTLAQIAFSAWLIRRKLPEDDSAKRESRYLRIVLVAAFIPAALDASLGVFCTWNFGFVKHSLDLEWAVWFAGYTLGVAIFFPLAQLLIDNWERAANIRPFAVSVPLVLVFAAFVISLHIICYYEQNRFAADFYDQTDHIQHSIVEKLDSNTQLLYSVAAFFESSNNVTRTDFQIFSSSILVRQTGVDSIMWLPEVKTGKESEFISTTRQQADHSISKTRQDALKDYSLKCWHEKRNAWVKTDKISGEVLLPTLYVEPFCTNQHLLGLNWMSHPEVQNAFFATTTSEDLQSTSPMSLGLGEKNEAVYIVVLKVGRILAHELLGKTEDGESIPSGLVAAIYKCKQLLPVDELINSDDAIAFKAVDNTTSTPVSLLQLRDSALHGHRAAPRVRRTFDHNMGGRKLTFIFEPTQVALDQVHGLLSVLTVYVGTCIIVLLQFVLLLVTGRAQTIERVVNERTSQLKHEISERERTQTELEKKAYALERSNLELDRFAYIASHDLKAPLRAIDQLSQWISEDVGDRAENQTKRHVELMQNRVRRLETLLDDLLNYARVKIDVRQLELVDINEVVNEIKFLLDAPEEFKFVVANQLPCFHTEKAAIEVCFRNLISNSVKHHDKSLGTIRVGSFEKGDFFEFFVDDDGPGIKPEYRNQVFDIFCTLKSRDEVEGSGMGLTLVKKIVEAVGGKIWIDDNDSDGTTIRFMWPKNVANTKERRAKQSAGNQTPPSSVAR